VAEGLEAEDRKVIGEDIKDVEFSWPIGMPLVGSLGREFWEVRSRLPRGRTARVVFCVEQGRMVLLHGFIKKTQKTASNTTSIWPLNGEKEQAHEKEKHRVILR
jgi:phage-related protein